MFKGYTKGQWERNVMTKWKKGEKRDQRFRHQSEHVVACRTEYKLIYLFWLQWEATGEF